MGLKNMEAGRREARTCDIGSKHRPKPSSLKPGETTTVMLSRT